MELKFRLLAPAMVLSLIVGCAGEEGAAPEPAASVNAPALPNTDPAKDETPAPPPIGDAAKDAAATPVEESKKVDAEPSLEGPKASADKLSDEEVAAIKELPAEDHEAALAQVVCPVSDHHLGSMDVPIKVSVENRTFYICCKGCEKDVNDDPKAVIAKLDKK